MSTSENLYELAGSIAVLRKRFLYHTDNNYCAAFILDHFVAEIASREEEAMFDREPVDHKICISITTIANRIFGLYDYDTVVKVVNLLINKKYLYNKGAVENTEDSYNFIVNRQLINGVTKAYQDEENRKWEKYKKLYPPVEQEQEETHTVIPQQPPYKQPLEQKYKTESGRVAYHCKRALALDLPATLTLEQWLDTLNHFDWKCAYCQGNYVLLEHFVPLNYPVGTTKTNCVPSCRKCNGIKGPYHPQAMPEKAEKRMLEAIQNIQQYFETCGSEE